MKSLSIKWTVILSFVLMFGIAFVIGVKFAQNNIQNAYNIILNQIQTSAFGIKHFLGSYYDENSLKTKKAHLDNLVAINDVIADMHIVSDTNQSLYDSDRDGLAFHPGSICYDIASLDTVDPASVLCVSVPVFSSSGGYRLLMYIDTDFINRTIIKPRNSYFAEYVIVVIIFLLISLWLLYRLLIRPMESLRHFAYYGEYAPKPFFIHELEGIRYSLSTTFKRLQTEQDKLYDLSIKDPLTGMNNRKALSEQLEWLIAQSKRSHERFALLFLDLDDFKYINDINGHDYGDRVLKSISSKMMEILRENDFVTRFGGDEFVIILSFIQDEAAVVETIKRLIQIFSTPISVNESSISITASIGVSLFPKDGNDSATLIKHADMAMYTAKENGKNGFAFFEDRLNLILQEELQVKKQIEDALANDYFYLEYQPQVELDSDTITGCEALIRLQHPEAGFIPPGRFIKVAERHGLIGAIGNWVLKTAVAQIEKWADTDLKSLKVAINISAIEFMQDNFVHTLLTTTENIHRKNLCIELTESVLMQRFEENIEKIQQLKELGFTVSLDDFGTGYSSLAYLKSLPIDILKIDKSFIDDILVDPNDKLFIEMIINIAHTLKLTTIAEGVETAGQLNTLSALGCDKFQGYYCSKPLTSNAFEKLFHSSRCE